MRKRLMNKKIMFKAIENVLKDKQEIWNGIPAVAATVHEFELLLAEIDDYMQMLQVNPNGITAQKAERQKVVISHTYELLSLVYAMAAKKNDPILLNRVNYTETDLLKMRDDQLVVICTAIASLVHDHLDELASYGVDENDVNVLKEEIGLFNDSLPSKRVTVVQRKAANEKLKELFVQTDALLKTQLDRLLVRFRNSDPHFYEVYRNARRIVNYGVRHEKPQEPENTAQDVNS